MSKNFEEEYKKLALDEVPDLWDRIEAGLSEKTAPATHASEDQREAAGKQDRAYRKKSDKQGKTVRVFFRRYAGAVAAVFCVFIIIPAVILIGRSGNKSFSEKMAGTAMEESAFETTEEESSSEEMKAAVEETAAGASYDEAVNAAAAEAVCEEAMVEGAYEEADEEPRVAGAMMGDGAASVDEYTMQKAESESVKEKKADQVGKVSVKIKAESEEAVNSVETSEGQKYEAIVVYDASGQLTEGEQILIFIPASSTGVVSVGQKALEMDLVYDPELDAYVMQKLY